MAMAVQQGAHRRRHQRQVEFSGLRFARQKFLEHECMFPASVLRRVRFDDGGDLITEAQDAAWLKADDEDAARDIGCKRGQRAFRLAPRLIDLADGENVRAAAQRAF